VRGGEEDSWGPGRGERVLVRGKYIWDLNKEEAAPNGHVLERVSATGGFDDGGETWLRQVGVSSMLSLLDLLPRGSPKREVE
jgi:hypothetical protein